jgi:1,4-alpha-glucan branching enzyme
MLNPTERINRLLQVDPWLDPWKDRIMDLFLWSYDRTTEVLGGKPVKDFALGHLFFGLHTTEKGQWFREYAPNAREMYLCGSFNDWQVQDDFRLQPQGDGVWTIDLSARPLKSGDQYLLFLRWPGGEGWRIPSYANYVIQVPGSTQFNAQVFDSHYLWQHPNPSQKPSMPLIYEAHIGMATERYGVGTYLEFRDDVLPRIRDLGYNTIQLMAIQEHPYYASFGYQVANFFAASSRFGTPDELKSLIDTAHGMGIHVVMDIVHSHSAPNTVEGLGEFDGTPDLYFHPGPRGWHPAWNSRCFDYSRPHTLHFLLSNCRYWLEEFRFDGFRFDGVTSMLYLDHGLGKAFSGYGDYYSPNLDYSAVNYLTLANELIHQVHPGALTIAEDMSGFPGMALPLHQGGLGFDFRLHMGLPDYWIRLLKERRDEDWHVGELFWTCSEGRPEEPKISYAESHDQALVGDKTIFFWLADKEAYTNMDVFSQNLVIDRAVALHKMIRLFSFFCGGQGYLNFMGNEFGHPEWIDFPREGNQWSYHYARRQWSLADSDVLRYHYLNAFDKAMIAIAAHERFDGCGHPYKHFEHTGDQVVAVSRGDLFAVFNFNPNQSFEHYAMTLPPGQYTHLMDTDELRFKGHGRIQSHQTYHSRPQQGAHQLQMYLPTRTALLLNRLPQKAKTPDQA